MKKRFSKLHPKIPIFEFNKITDSIYVGTNQCCQTHLNSILIKKGIKADISLEENKIDQPFGVKYYCWLPTKNLTPPTQKQLFIGCKAISSLIASKMKVYIHCKNGHGRAPTLVCAYLIYNGGTTREAINFFKRKRSSMHLDKTQVKALEKFERWFKK